MSTGRYLIDFVRGSSALDNSKDGAPSQQSFADGDDIKNFYEDLVQTDFQNSASLSQSDYEDSRVTRKARRKNKTHSDEKYSTSKLSITRDRESVSNFSYKKGTKAKHFDRECESETSTRKSRTLKTIIESERKFRYGGKEDSTSSHLYQCENDYTQEELQRMHGYLLNYSQNGEFDKLKSLIDTGLVDLNLQDQYGWTALMCAGVAKHADIVKYLLHKGADKFIQNRHKQTVVDMCGDFLEEIKQNEKKKESTRRKNKKEKRKMFHCEICDSDFRETSLKEHNASTIHLFSLKLQPKPDAFMIQDSNVGFQLMQKSGWDGESGLGTRQQGQKYPIKTTLKRDRKCLGNFDKKEKAKVTHFGPNDTGAVKSLKKQSERIMTARAICKRERNRKLLKDKKWERDLRTYMNLE